MITSFRIKEIVDSHAHININKFKVPCINLHKNVTKEIYNWAKMKYAGDFMIFIP